jgi:hypothetical protein
MALTVPLVDGRTCTKCSVWYETSLIERAFRTQRGRRDASRLRKAICVPCEQEARDKRKRVDRFPAKARDVTRRHALRLSVPKPGAWHEPELTKEDLVRRFGWDAATLAHDAEFQYGNGCSYCRDPYRDMGHGLADMTLDIQDRSRPPYYRTNTKWCCQTCNRKKHILEPDEWETDLRVYAERQRQLKLAPEDRGMLF